MHVTEPLPQLCIEDSNIYCSRVLKSFHISACNSLTKIWLHLRLQKRTNWEGALAEDCQNISFLLRFLLTMWLCRAYDSYSKLKPFSVTSGVNPKWKHWNSLKPYNWNQQIELLAELKNCHSKLVRDKIFLVLSNSNMERSWLSQGFNSSN